MEHKPDDHEKLETLYHLYEQKMYRIAYSIINNAEQSEDAVQDSFYKIFGMIDKIKSPESLKTKRLIMRIVKNKAIDIYRSNQREYGLFSEIAGEQMPQHQTRDDHNISHIIEQETVRQLLAELPEDYREILKYRVFYELSSKETADILVITESAVRKRYERAKKYIIKMSGDERYEAI